MRKRISFHQVAAGGLMVFAIYFCFLPVFSVLLSGLQGNGGVIGAKEWSRALGLLGNSVGLAITVTLASLFLASVAAFTLHRTRFKGRQAMKLLMLMPLVNPAFVGSISFIMLFGRRGLITHQLLGLSISPFGWHGVFVLQTIGFTTLAYLMISAAVQNVDTQLEDAARNLGAWEREVFLRVTLPMMMPEMTSAGMLVFLGSMADFTTPMIIGGNFRTLATDLYIQITGLYNIQLASFSGVVLLVPCLLVFVFQYRMANRKKYYGDASQSVETVYEQLPVWMHRLLIGITATMISLFVINIMFVFVGAFTVSWGADYSFTLKHLQTVLNSNLQMYMKPLFNSIALAVFTGVGSSLLGVMAAYWIQRKMISYGKGLDAITMLPATVPGILLGVGCLVTFRYPFFGIGKWILTSQPPLILLGTTTIVYLVCIARNIHVSMKSCYAVLEHVDPEIEQAARNLGAGEWTIYRRVTLPLLKDAFANSFIKVFSSTMTALGVIIFLLMPRNKVIVQVLFQSMTGGLNLGVPAVLALMLSLVTLGLMLLFQLMIYGKDAWARLRRLGQ